MEPKCIRPKVVEVVHQCGRAGIITTSVQSWNAWKYCGCVKIQKVARYHHIPQHVREFQISPHSRCEEIWNIPCFVAFPLFCSDLHTHARRQIGPIIWYVEKNDRYVHPTSLLKSSLNFNTSSQKFSFLALQACRAKKERSQCNISSENLYWSSIFVGKFESKSGELGSSINYCCHMSVS